MDIAKQAEKTLIGSIILKPDSLTDVNSVISPDDLSCENARKSYMLAISLWRQKKQIDLVSLATEDKTLVSYLASATSDGTELGIKDTARTVATLAKERRVNTGLDEIRNSELPVGERINDVLKLYQREMSVERKNPKISAVLDRYDTYVKENKKRGRLGISTGFSFLDDKYIQFCPGHIWVMGAYTSVGKTAMAVQMLCNLISSPECPKIVFICAEMTEEQMMSRILGNFTGIYSKKIEAGNLEPHEIEAVETYKGMLRKKPVVIYDDVTELSHIENVFRKEDLQGGVDVGFVDYVQNCRVKGLSKAYDIGEQMSKGFQQLAKEVRCCLVCLSQVSNDVGRGNTDQLEFKGAGEWAAVADVGIHLKKKDDQLKFLIKKNRHGPLHEHLFQYNRNWSSLHELCEI